MASVIPFVQATITKAIAHKWLSQDMNSSRSRNRVVSDIRVKGTSKSEKHNVATREIKNKSTKSIIISTTIDVMVRTKRQEEQKKQHAHHKFMHEYGIRHIDISCLFLYIHQTCVRKCKVLLRDRESDANTTFLDTWKKPYIFETVQEIWFTLRGGPYITCTSCLWQKYGKNQIEKKVMT
ncbi:hypothetical protein FF38_09093 [Lucilia cuprina]|uniref:Uncharacterized protein n=1 Tax=Lucilia cuprina TaxID=7375 RepID=A0A0L0C7E9_LUCCU|nr:hypothetical protein FF38_09093 [Lucilia cuprina]